jgi:hypothetical protein
LVFTACTPDAPPEAIPRYLTGLQFNPDNFPGPGVLTDISSNPCIPGQGNCTMILPSSPSVSHTMGIALSNLKRSYIKNDLQGFFSSERNWDKLFPGLQYSSDTLQKIIDGTYKIRITNDNKAIVIYKNAVPDPGNIIKVYWLNKQAF